MCSMAVAEGLPAAALVLLSYPLHPPGKPDRLRVEHFGGHRCARVVRERRPGSLRHARGVRGPYRRHPRRDVTVRWLEGQSHDPKPSTDTEIVAAVGAFLVAL